MSSTQAPARSDESSPRHREAGFRGFLQSSAIFTLGPIIGRVLGLLVVPFVVDALGPEDFGRFELLSTAASALAAIVLVGLDLSSISLFHRPDGRDPLRVFPSALAVAVVFGLLAALLVGIGRERISSMVFGSSTYGVSVALVGLYGLVSVAGLVGRAALRAKERAAQHSVVTGLTSTITTLIVISVIVGGGSVRGILTAHVAGAMFGTLLTLWLARDVLQASPEIDMGRSLLVLGVPQVVAIVAVWGGEVLHRTILNEVVGPEAVGALGIGARIALALLFVVVGMQSAWHPRVFDLLDRPDGMPVVIKDATRIGVLLSVAALGLAVVASPGVEFLGRGQFTSDSVAIAGWMVVMVTGTGFLQMATLHSVTERKFGDTTVALLVGLAVSIGIAAVLVPSNGLLGGAVGSAIALASSQWIAAGVGWVLAGRGNSLQLPVRIVGSAAIAMPACVLITSDGSMLVKVLAGLAALVFSATQLWGTRPAAGS